MHMPRGSGPGVPTVIAAQAGDSGALDRLMSGYLPLVYNIAGRALSGHADVDDVVQETMLRAVHGLGDLRDPAAFRSWLVAVAIRQMRDHYRARQAAPVADLSDDVADPAADFVGLTILRLGLSSQREETAQASRWLDPADRELLALWWLEAAGELGRGEVVAALGLPPGHVAVRISRMKEQLTTARVVVRALRAEPPCPDLALAIAGWGGSPGPLWRKRIARHIRDCGRCSAQQAGLVPAERLLAGLPLVPLPAAAPAPAMSAAPAKPAPLRAAGGGHRAAGRAAARPRPWHVLAQGSGPVKLAAAPAATTARKGVGAWAFTGATQALAESGASWYYTWSPTPGVAGPPGVQFVPMIWGSANVTASTLSQVKQEGPVLLGFNEPDMSSQSNLTPAQALSLWPQLMATGMQLGSPLWPPTGPRQEAGWTSSCPAPPPTGTGSTSSRCTGTAPTSTPPRPSASWKATWRPCTRVTTCRSG
jgi:RNA polymerase sigma factor (sigma-70 family)